MEEFADKGLEFETKEMMSKFSLEVIASTAFGVEAEAFTNPDGVFSDRVSEFQASFVPYILHSKFIQNVYFNRLHV